MQYRIIYTVILMGWAAGGLLAQSGWTKNKGDWYLQTDASFFSSNRYYSADGELNTGNTFYSYSLKSYAEYGLNDRFTAVLNWPLLKLQHFSVTQTAAGLGDLQMGFKYALLKKLPVAIGISAEIPMDDGQLFAQAKEVNELGIRERINLPASDGEWNFRSYLAVSQSFAGGHTYGSLSGGINLRTRGYTHQWEAGAEVGQFLWQRLWLIGKLKWQNRFGDTINRSVSFLYGEGTTYTAYNFTLLYHLSEHWRLAANYQDYSDLLTPKRNIYDGSSFSLGLAWEY